MSAPKITHPNERHNSITKESSSRARPERFREYYAMKVEKAEEEEKKRPSIFEVVAEENPLAASPNFSVYSLCASTSSSNITPISKGQSDWIVAEANLAIVHCIKNGIKETSVRLDGTSFIGSPLQGVELIVREFNTAPAVFNIEFRGSVSAITFLQPHLVTLSAALHSDKKKEFLIHRVELELEGDSSPFLFHRKPSPEGNPNYTGG